jgi:hypothetical protein
MNSSATVVNVAGSVAVTPKYPGVTMRGLTSAG